MLSEQNLDKSKEEGKFTSVNITEVFNSWLLHHNSTHTLQVDISASNTFFLDTEQVSLLKKVSRKVSIYFIFISLID